MQVSILFNQNKEFNLMTLNISYKELEQKIIDQEKVIKYQNVILSSIPALLFELSEDGEYIDLWAHDEDELAHSKELLLNRNVSEMLPAKASAIVMTAIKEAKDKGKSQGHVIQLETPNGKEWFELSTSSEQDNLSSQNYIMLSRNITKQKEAEIKGLEILAEIKILQGTIPICSYCHNIRGGDGDWERLERYISERSDANFSHGICPNCLPKAYLDAGIELK